MCYTFEDAFKDIPENEVILHHVGFDRYFIAKRPTLMEGSSFVQMTSKELKYLIQLLSGNGDHYFYRDSESLMYFQRISDDVIYLTNTNEILFNYIKLNIDQFLFLVKLVNEFDKESLELYKV